MQVEIPALHPQSKLTTLRWRSVAWRGAAWRGISCLVMGFWDLMSAPALMELDITCRVLRITDYSRTAPPAAVAALERGVLDARIKVQINIESSLQPELAIMESCGMIVQSIEKIRFDHKVKRMTLELGRRVPEMVDVRHFANLPFTPAALSSHQRLADDSFLEHALQQQAWHAEFLYHDSCDSDDLQRLQEPGLLSVL